MEALHAKPRALHQPTIKREDKSLRRAALASLGIVIVAAGSAQALANAPAGDTVGSDLARVQAALRGGDLKILPTGNRTTTSVDGSHAVRTAQGPCWRAYNGSGPCPPGFSQ